MKNKKSYILILGSLMSVVACQNFSQNSVTDPTVLEPDLGTTLSDQGIILPQDLKTFQISLNDASADYSKIKPWGSCEALSHAVVNQTLSQFYEYYKNDVPCQPLMMDTTATDSAEMSSEGSASNATVEFTKQNSQIAGVLEADTVFANATHVFQVYYDQIHVYQTWPKENFAQLNSLENPFENNGLVFKKIILSENTLYAFAQLYPLTSKAISAEVSSIARDDSERDFTLLIYDVSVANAPTLLEKTVYKNADFVTARLAESKLHVFGKSRLAPEVNYYPADLDLSDGDICEGVHVSEGTMQNVKRYIKAQAQELIAFQVEDVLPKKQHINVSGDVIAEASLDCENIYATTLQNGDSVFWGDVISVENQAQELGSAFDVALQSNRGQVYMNQETLVLYETINPYRFDVRDENQNQVSATTFNLIQIENEAITPYTWIAHTALSGTLDSSWQIDVQGDVMRVVTEVRHNQQDVFFDPAPDAVRFYTLSVEGEALKIEGQIDSLVEGEEIYGVRYIQDKAYIVTMLTTYFWDPLFVIDTSDILKPKVLGSLEMPGFSSYLELIDENTLMGIGYNSDCGWMVCDLKVSLYDVGDSALPSELANHIFEDSYGFGALTHLQVHVSDVDGTKKMFVPYSYYDEEQNIEGQRVSVVSLENNTVTEEKTVNLNSTDSVERTIRYYDGNVDVLYVITVSDVYPIDL